MQLRTVEADVWMRNAHLSMPFRFGHARMTAAPILYVRVTVEADGHECTEGVAADLLPPAWFDKRPGREYSQDIADLVQSVEIARLAYLESPPASPFELWRTTFDHIVQTGINRGLARLAAGFGASVLERALIDAAARLQDHPAWQLVLNNELGIDFGALNPTLRNVAPSELVSPKPANSMWVRHTVGLADPLAIADVAEQDRLHDGLPQTLQEVIRFYGVSYFKLKLCGEIASDIERLKRIAALLEPLPDSKVTLDGNEQYRSWSQVEQLTQCMRDDAQLRRLYNSVLYLEQPLARDVALQNSEAQARGRVMNHVALLIDESDDEVDAFARAVALGYRGISFKACKGFYRALSNKALAKDRNRTGRGDFFLSAEDLTALPCEPLEQSLVLAAILGISHQERNGHHYVHGLYHLTGVERHNALTAHPDLYTGNEENARLNLNNGSLQLRSLMTLPGLGGTPPPPWQDLEPSSAWRFESLGLDKPFIQETR